MSRSVRTRKTPPPAEDDRAAVAGEKNGVKGRNLARDGRFALCVDEDRPPYAFVLLRGHAEVSDNPDDMLHWGGLLGARYTGDHRAEEYAARNGGPGNLLVRGRVDKVIAFDGIAD
ncbi:pyridoxamine 5'-phosphate oxidase family protein [Streptomyces akebiae]|uniref:pyridoxamine 5'-phosphate oxidase family protein n=1 Tax=Streptomyces akebiae TaxID=2865673 RepID=UPI0037DA7657